MSGDAMDALRLALTTHRPYPILTAVRPKSVNRLRGVIAREAADGATTTAAWEYEEPPRLDLDTLDGVAAALRAARLHPHVRHAGLELLDAERVAFTALSTRDDARLNAWSVDRYGLPTPAALADARNLLDSIPPEPEIPTIPASALAKLARDTLDRLRIDGWTVVVVDGAAARCSVVPSRRECRIDGTRRFGRDEARRLLAHEIGGHVVRTENARRQAHRLAELPLGDATATATEEGLATWAETRVGVQRLQERRTYTLRALAVSLSTRLGILPLIRELAAYTTLEQAAEIAVRVKRGMRDPNQPGGFTKDHLYLSGFREVSATLARDPTLIPVLYATKWSLGMTDLVRELVDAGELDLSRVLVPSDDVIAVAGAASTEEQAGE